MATKPKNQINLAQISAREKLNFNNSITANTSNQLVSILEGDGSGIARDQLDQYLHNHIVNKLGNADRQEALNYQWKELRKFSGIKEKLAYTIGILYAENGYVNQSIELDDTRNIENERLDNTLNEIIEKIESDLLNNKDFTESWILRNAATNRFECELSMSETQELNSLATKVSGVCKANRLETLVESTHFTSESNAQKILKISDTLIQMSAQGITISDDILKGFEKFDAKIKPLRDLDKHYKHVTKTLNMLHNMVQKGYHSAIRPKQQVKLDQVISKLEMTNTVNETLKKYNDIENFDKNEEGGILNTLCRQIQEKEKYKETIYSMGMSDAEFTEWFYSSCGFVVTTIAKKGLDNQRDATFGAKAPDFEKDTQFQRGKVRNKIFAIADKMNDISESKSEFQSTADFNEANSLFNQFPNLFFAKEEDNYKKSKEDKDQLHYHKIEKVLSAILRTRVPALDAQFKVRRGSGGRILYKFIENALKGKERGIFKWIRRIWNSADDASIFAMIIMAQNETKNQIYYQNKDKSQKHENRYGKILNKIAFVRKGRDDLSDAISPTANKALAFTEEAFKKGATLGKGALKVTNTVVSNTAKAGSYIAKEGTGKFNAMMKKNGYKRWKTLLYPIYGATSIIKPLSDRTYEGSSYLAKEGGKHVDELGDTVNKGYEGAKDMVSKATGKKVEGLFEGLLYGVEETTKLAAKGVSSMGQRAKDNYDTRQKSSILGALYTAAQEDAGLFDLMQSTNLQEILNIQERGPYLFDKDGRIGITQSSEERYPEDETGEKNVKKDILGKKYDEIQGQFTNFMDTLKKKHEAQDMKLEDLPQGSPERDTAEKQIANLEVTIDTRNEGKGSMDELLLIIQQFALGTISETPIFKTEVSNKVEEMAQREKEGELLVDNEDNTTPGYKQQIKESERKIKEKNVELEKIKDKMGTNVKEGDLGYTELKDKQDRIELKIKGLKTDKSNKGDELIKKEKELVKNTKKRDGLEGEIQTDTKEIKGLPDQRDLWISTNIELETKIDDLAKLNKKEQGQIDAQKRIDLLKKELSTTADETKKEEIEEEIKMLKTEKEGLEEINIKEKKQTLGNEIRKLGETLRKIGQTSFPGATTPAGVDDFIQRKKKSIEDNRASLDELETIISGLEGEKNKIKGEIQDIEDLINKERKELDDAERRIVGKSFDDKSRNIYKTESKKIQNEIEILEGEKGEITKKMYKQQEKNRVYKKIHQRGRKVETLSKTLEDVHSDTGLDESQKAKLFIQRIKAADINFNLQPEVIQKKIGEQSDKGNKDIVDAFKQEQAPLDNAA